MNYSGGAYLAMAGVDFATALIAGGSMLALVVVLVCFRAMTRGTEGYVPSETPRVSLDETAQDAEASQAPAEKKRTGTAGFVLPLPASAPPAAAPKQASAPPAVARSADPLPLPQSNASDQPALQQALMQQASAPPDLPPTQPLPADLASAWIQPQPAPVQLAPAEVTPAWVQSRPAPVEPLPVHPLPVQPAPVELNPAWLQAELPPVQPAPVELTPAWLEPAPTPAEPVHYEVPRDPLAEPAPEMSWMAPAMDAATPPVPLDVEPQPRTNHRSMLVFRNGAREAEIVLLDNFLNGICAIGRSDVPENQVVIRDDPKVSRMQHAILASDSAGRYSVRDNNSANRVYVNEECIDSDPVLLNDGDRIRIGLTEFEYVKEPCA